MPTMIPVDELLSAQENIAPSSANLIPVDTLAVPKAAPTRTPKEELLHQLGLRARDVGTALTGTGAMFGDAIAGTSNLLNAAGSKLFGLPNNQMGFPSESIQHRMTEAGLPEPKSPLEKATSFLFTAGMGTADPLLRATQKGIESLFNVPKQFTKPNAQPTNITEELMRNGVKLPPSVAEGGPLARTVEGFSGKNQLAEKLAQDNQETFNALARKALGFPEGTRLDNETLQNFIKHQVTQGYDPLRSLPSFGNFRGIGVGGQFRQDMANIVGKYAGGDSFQTPADNPIKQLVNHYLFEPNGRYRTSFSGEDAVNEIRQLRFQADANLATGDGEKKVLGLAQKGVAKALEDNIEINLRAMPRYANSGLLEKFQAARQNIAKAETIKDALIDPVTGNVSAQKVAGARQNGAPVTDQLRVLANAGSPYYGGSTRPPSGAGLIPMTELGGYGGAAGLMSFLGHNYLGGALAAYPAAKLGARQALSSDLLQKRAMNRLGVPGFFATPVGQRSLVSGLEELPYFSLGGQ